MAGYIGSKASVVSSGAERKKTFAITTSTTSLTGLSYTVDQVHVFHNGVRLVDGTDYTATNGTSITLTSAAESGDEVVVVSYATFQTSDTVSASAGGTFSAPVTIDGNSATVLTVDRATTDGTVIDVQKNGSTAGSIGVHSSSVLYAGTGDTGIAFQPAFDVVIPFNPSTNDNRDNAVSLGANYSRFKDLYLSGGVYLGGTGSANKLDDYEEGTFTPTVTFGGGTAGQVYGPRVGYYTKIGQNVTVTFYVQLTTRGTSTGIAYIEGMPFACKSGLAYSAGSLHLNAVSFTGFPQAYNIVGSTTVTIGQTTDAGVFSGLTSANFVNYSGVIYTATYQTDA